MRNCAIRHSLAFTGITFLFGIDYLNITFYISHFHILVQFSESEIIFHEAYLNDRDAVIERQARYLNHFD